MEIQFWRIVDHLCDHIARSHLAQAAEYNVTHPKNTDFYDKFTELIAIYI